MMKTIMVVSQVSFQLGQVTFFISAAHLLEEFDRPTRRAATGASASPVLRPSFSSRRPFHTLLTLNWQERRDSNPRPSVLETDALPAELHSYAGLGLFRFAGPRLHFNYIRRRRALSPRSGWQQSYLIIFATTPAPTVRPPSRMAKRSFSSIAIGTISSTSHETLSPGITISVPAGSLTMPVTSVVRK